MNRALPAWTLTAFLLGLGACAGSAAKPDRSPAPAPAFQVQDQRGRTWTREDSGSKPLLVDLWATWCAPCIQALPDLNRFAKAHSDKLTVLGLATDQQGWPVVTPVLKRYELSYPVAVIQPDLSQAFGAKAYPTLLLLDQGNVVLRLEGRHSYNELEEALAAWLK